MNELKFIKDLGVIVLSILLVYVLVTYVFEDAETLGYGLSLGLVLDFLRITYRYYKFVQFKREHDCIYLKSSPMSLGSFHSPIIMIIGFGFFYYTNIAWFIIPFFVLEALFIFQFEKNQVYGFGDWSIKDLSDNKSIKRSDIQEFEFHTNKLTIGYFEEGDETKKRLLTIRRDELAAPRSWYEFEKIARRFEKEVLQKE